MSAEKQLAFRVAAPTGTHHLKPRQALAYEWVCNSDGGTTATDLGAYLHWAKGKHAIADTCRFCNSEGSSVLRSKALRPLVVYRRKRQRWEPRLRDPQPAPELAGDTFEDLFR
jgi:hypothetical protein